jgi:hypothetical protein
VFQGLASLAAPFLIIHSTVNATTSLCKTMGAKTAIRVAPSAAGLALIPFLPSMVDEPIEELGACVPMLLVVAVVVGFGADPLSVIGVPDDF